MHGDLEEAGGNLDDIYAMLLQNNYGEHHVMYPIICSYIRIFLLLCHFNNILSSGYWQMKSIPTTFLLNLEAYMIWPMAR